jgi:hypothetical protein
MPVRRAVEMTDLRNARLMRRRTPIAYYRKDLAVHAKKEIVRVPRMKTQLARRNGTRTKKGTGIKRRSSNHTI